MRLAKAFLVGLLLAAAVHVVDLYMPGTKLAWEFICGIAIVIQGIALLALSAGDKGRPVVLGLVALAWGAFVIIDAIH